MVDRRLLGKHEELFFFQIIDARPGIRRPHMLAQVCACVQRSYA